MNRDKISRKV